jgi:hypothetical protein
VSKNSKIRFLVVLPAVTFLAFAVSVPDLGALAQNTNGSTTENEAMPTDTTAAAAQDPDTGTRSPGEPADLSGTYTGNVRMTGGHEMNGQGTLTITGNTFTLESEGMTHSGRVIAITTRGYTGASFYFNDVTDPASNTSLAASVRARHGGGRLSLTPVPGARNRFWFNAGGGGGGGRRRRGRRRGGAMNMNANTNMDENMNMNTNNSNTTP